MVSSHMVKCVQVLQQQTHVYQMANKQAESQSDWKFVLKSKKEYPWQGSILYYHHDHQQYGFLWLLHTIRPYQPLLFLGPLDGKLCLHTAGLQFEKVGTSTIENSIFSIRDVYKKEQ